MNPLFLFRKEITPVRKLLLMHLAAGGKLIEQTATGNPLTFVTDVEKPLSSLLIPFTPVQSGTGDPSPENVRPIVGTSAVNAWRTGKNLIDDSKKYQNGTTTVYVGATDNGRNIFLKAGKYTVTRDFGGELIGLYYLKRDSSSEKTIFSTSATETTKTITVAEDGYYAIFAYRGSASGGASVSDIKKVQIEPGETATAYAPYTGNSYPVVFPALGKNLFDKTDVESDKSIDASGKIVTVSDYVLSNYIPINGQCVFTATQLSSTGGKLRLATYDSSKTFIERFVATSVGVGSKENITVNNSNVAYVRVCFNQTTESIDDAMVELGTTASSYEPYTNTCYGGTLDLVTGVLTVEWNGFSKTWGDGDSATDMGNDITRKVYPMVDYLTTGQTNNMCNIAPYGANENVETHFYYSGSGSTNRKCRVFLPSDTPDTTVVTVITKLSQTYTVQLTPSEITALLGDNVIWSDTIGTNTAVYLKKG